MSLGISSGLCSPSASMVTIISPRAWRKAFLIAWPFPWLLPSPITMALEAKATFFVLSVDPSSTTNISCRTLSFSMTAVILEMISPMVLPSL